MKVKKRLVNILILTAIIIFLAFLESFIIRRISTEIALAIEGTFFIFIFLFSIACLIFIYKQQKIDKIGSILAGSYALLVLYTVCHVAIFLNMGQAEFAYLQPMWLLGPLQNFVWPIRRFILLPFWKIFENGSGSSFYLIVFPFLSFIVPLLLIGCTAYYLFGKSLSLTIKNFKTARALSIANLITLIMFILTMIIAGQWKGIAQKNQFLYASQLAHADFEKGRLRLFELCDCETSYFTGKTFGKLEIWTKPNTRAIGIPYRIDDRIFVELYNDTMKRLAGLETGTCPSCRK
ncbi:MAG: hypothetical protein NC906_01380 [Candidatus Omnitrophica bacterium]|nr:hypothetical protein [Candidatus Omnitrophota bacterium]